MLSYHHIVLFVVSWLMDWWPIFSTDLCFFHFALSTELLIPSIMAHWPHTELLDHLTNWFVGDYKCEEFYKLFNLEVCDYVKLPFKEMINIFSLDPLMQWHSALKGSKRQSSNYAITLVSFKPIASNDGDDRRQKAHMKVHEMFKDCFDDGSMNKVDVCTKTFPMRMAIFLSKKMKTFHNKRKLPASKQNTGSCKEKSSIFDSNQWQVHCLSAVNYFWHKQNTVMLWLATTRSKPFKESINCMWRHNGLVTYLLCMLIKQHTCAGPNMDDSVLCLQASNEKPNVGRYYQCLGFSHVINFDMTMDYLKPVMNFKWLQGTTLIVGTLHHLIFFASAW